MRMSARTAARVVLMAATLSGEAALAEAAGPPPDFNGDLHADLVIGVPCEAIGSVVCAGAVHIIYGGPDKLKSAGDQLWYSTLLGDPPAVGDVFGASLAWGDFNGDLKTDLAIGAPGRGKVYILYGTSAGLATGGTQILEGDQSDSWFGGALAVGRFNNDDLDDLAIGAKFYDVDPPAGPVKSNSGAVFVYPGGGNGLTADGAVELLWGNELLLEGSVDSVHDEFGSALATGDFDRNGYDDLAVGVPRRDLTSVLVDVGLVAIFSGSATGITLADPVEMMQGGGAAETEANDRFGQVLAAGDFDGDGYDDLVVGVPLEDVGGIVNAGAITAYLGSSTGVKPSSFKHWHQDSSAIGILMDDQAEANDWFGYSLAVGDFNGDTRDDLAIGVPFEDLGSKLNVGAIQIMYGYATPRGLSAVGNDFIHQGSSKIKDNLETDDVFGRTLVAADFDNDGFADVAIGVPGEDLGGLTDVGAMQVVYGASTGIENLGNQLWWQDSPGIEGVAEANDGFGNGFYGRSP